MGSEPLFEHTAFSKHASTCNRWILWPPGLVVRNSARIRIHQETVLSPEELVQMPELTDGPKNEKKLLANDADCDHHQKMEIKMKYLTFDKTIRNLYV